MLEAQSRTYVSLDLSLLIPLGSVLGAVRLGCFSSTCLSQEVRPWAALPTLFPGHDRGQPAECIGQSGTERPGPDVYLLTAGQFVQWAVRQPWLSLPSRQGPSL